MSKQLQIGNYYGCLSIKKKKGKCYWGIDNWDYKLTFSLRNK